MKTAATSSRSSTTLPPTTSRSTPAPPKATCSYDLAGRNFEFPHWIQQTSNGDHDKPDYVFGFGNPSLNGTVIGKYESSIFNFDIPAKDAGKTCTLRFLFPMQSQLETSAFEFKEPYDVPAGLVFSQLAKPANEYTMHSDMTSAVGDAYEINIRPGNAYKVTDFLCPAGKMMAWRMDGVETTLLNYFQDYNPCPIGLYITVE
jgi:hypothetical protein